MSYVKTINEDGVVSDIMAKALDPTLDATVLKKSNLVNGFTQDTAGVNALDAAAGKTLNDTKADKLSPVLQFRLGSAQTADDYPHAAIEEGGGSTSRVVAVRAYTDASTYTGDTLVGANGTFLPAYTKTADLLGAESDLFYTGSRAVVIRGVATGTSDDEARIMYYPPVPYKSNSTPTVSSITASVTGIGTVTATLDTVRSNRYCLMFTLTKTSGFTNHSSYLAQVNFTV